MRVKTDARRQAILKMATEVFREVGYERASMTMISSRLGGSKATLYNYFTSKEELFAAAMIGAVEDQAQETIDLLDPSQPDVQQVLRRFGEAYLRLITDPAALAITRTAVAQGSSSLLGAELYARGPERAWDEVTGYIRNLQARAVLRPGEPRLMAAHLKGMFEAGFIEPLLYGAPIRFEPAEAVEAAVQAFLRAYAL